jgi:two-component system, chemotaxis family, chemotaxis protein CheY
MTQGTDEASPGGQARLTALVVEDSPPMRKMIVFALSRIRELRVVEADDGVDALRRIASTKFDIIITDINMPILDGLKLVKRLRADEAYRDVPIIIITTEGAEEDRQRALALGATAYITKPIQAPQVIELVREVLGLAEGRR